MSADRGSPEDIVITPRELWHGPARYEPVSAWGPVGALLLTGAASVGFGAVVVIGLAIAKLAGVPSATVHATVEETNSLASPLGIAAVAASQLLSLAVIWIAAGRGGWRRETLRLAPPTVSWGTAVTAGMLVIVAMSLVELALYLSVGFDPFADAGWLLEGLRSPLWLGTVLIAVGLAPLWEEVAFRGFLLSALAKAGYGYWPAALVSTLLWTLLHWTYSPAGMASVFTAGLVLSWVMWRTGSLRAVVVAHAMANMAALAFTAVFAPVAA